MKKTTEWINETKIWFLKKINKIDKTNQTPQEKKRERSQIKKIRNKKGTGEAQKYERSWERDYYKQLQANKMENLEEMHKFLGRYKLSRRKQEEIANMNIPITSTKIETVI